MNILTKIYRISLISIFFYILSSCSSFSNHNFVASMPDRIVMSDGSIQPGILRSVNKNYVILEREGKLFLFNSDNIRDFERHSDVKLRKIMDDLTVCETCLEGDCENGRGVFYRREFNIDRIYIIKADFKNGVPGGKGMIEVYREDDGTVEWIYKGDIVQGMREGVGTLEKYDPAGNKISEASGEWTQGKPDGEHEQKAFYENGNTKYVVKGSWKGGNLTGRGESREYYKNGQMSFYYSGDFVKGKHNGRGQESYYSKNGVLRHTYDGEWSNHLRNGYGTIILFNNRGTKTLVYEGGWKDGERHGSGKIKRYDEQGIEIENP